MKTQEEIVTQAKAYAEFIGNEDGTSAFDYIMGYNNCQQDMADNRYTEEDMIKFAFHTYCYISGIMKVPFNQVSENRTHAEDNLKVFINSLNKQD